MTVEPKIDFMHSGKSSLIRSSDVSGNLGQRGTLVSSDVIGFVTLDFVLWFIVAGMMGVSLVVEIAGMDFDDMPGYFTGF